jgi:tripartite-type tricarboxylate transporter receptor subunit TctC
MIARSPYVFVTSSAFPANNLKEFVSHARLNPNKISIANSEKYSLLVNQKLVDSEKLDAVHVPYKGSGPMLIDVAANVVSMSPTSILAATPYLQSGRMKAIGVTGDERTPALPNVPTLKEQGFKDYDFYVTYGLYAPAGTPRIALDTMQRAIKEVVETPDMKAILADKGAVPVASTVDDFNAHQKAYFLTLKGLAEKFNLKSE